MVTTIQKKPGIGQLIGRGFSEGFSQGMSEQDEKRRVAYNEQLKQAQELRKAEGLRQALDQATKFMQTDQFRKAPIDVQDSYIRQLMASSPEMGQQMIQSRQKEREFGLEEKKYVAKKAEEEEKLQAGYKQAKNIGKQRGLEGEELEEFAQTYKNNPTLAEKVTKEKAPPGGPSFQPIPADIAKKKAEVIRDNPDASASELELKLDEAGIPQGFYKGEIETRRRKEEMEAKSKEGKLSEARKETLDYRKELANKATTATESLALAKQQKEIIRRNGLNDPTVAAFLDKLPWKLGARFLSPDTIEYKGTLVPGFKGMKNTFTGTTRVAEINIWEDKLPGLYLTDEQKERMIDAFSKGYELDIIKADLADEIEQENPGISLLKLRKEVDKRAKEKLFGQIADDINTVFYEAEQMKKRPLDQNNERDAQVIQQIFREAGWDGTSKPTLQEAKKAEEIAKKKGYKL